MGAADDLNECMHAWLGGIFKRNSKTAGPMQITNNFGEARSLCGAHFMSFIFFFFHLFNKKNFIFFISFLSFFFVKNQHFFTSLNIFLSFVLIIWRHFMIGRDESGPLLVFVDRKILQNSFLKLKTALHVKNWIEKFEWVLFYKYQPFYCRNL